MKKEWIFIIRRGDQIVAVCDSMAETAEYVKASVSAVSRAITCNRPTRNGYMIERRERMYLCKRPDGAYSIRTAKEAELRFLDISESYYKGKRELL